MREVVTICDQFRFATQSPLDGDRGDVELFVDYSKLPDEITARWSASATNVLRLLPLACPSSPSYPHTLSHVIYACPSACSPCSMSSCPWRIALRNRDGALIKSKDSRVPPVPTKATVP